MKKMLLVAILSTACWMLHGSQQEQEVAEFKRLVMDSVLEKPGAFSKLQAFVRDKQVGQGVKDETIKFLGELFDSRFFTMKPRIAHLLSPELTFPQKNSFEVRTKDNAVADYICLSIKIPDHFKIAQFVYAKNPICVDAYSVRTGNGVSVNLGDVLDHFQGRFRAELLDLVRGERWTKVGNDPENKKFVPLLIAALVKQHEYSLGELTHYLNDRNWKLCGDREAITKLPVGFTLGENSKSVADFFEDLNPRLFPYKNVVYKILDRQGFQTKGKVHTQETDKQFIEDLVRATVTAKDLMPLLRYAYRSYEKTYILKKASASKIDIFKISYQGKSVGSYLTKRKRLSEVEEYENIFFDVTREVKVSSIEGAKKNEPMAFWKKILIAGAVGAVMCGVYTYYPSKKRAATTQAA